MNNESIYGVLAELYRVILYKREHGGEKSYTKYLFMKGQDTNGNTAAKRAIPGTCS